MDWHHRVWTTTASINELELQVGLYATDRFKRSTDSLSKGNVSRASIGCLATPQNAPPKYQYSPTATESQLSIKQPHSNGLPCTAPVSLINHCSSWSSHSTQYTARQRSSLFARKSRNENSDTSLLFIGFWGPGVPGGVPGYREGYQLGYREGYRGTGWGTDRDTGWNTAPNTPIHTNTNTPIKISDALSPNFPTGER